MSIRVHLWLNRILTAKRPATMNFSPAQLEVASKVGRTGPVRRDHSEFSSALTAPRTGAPTLFRMRLPLPRFLPTLILLLLLPGPWLDAQPKTGGRAAPRLGYVYPAGAQRGTEVHISVGGQNLDASAISYFSAIGLTARVLDYERPLNQKELVDLRERIEQLQKKKRADKTSFTADDERSLAELSATMARRNNRQALPGLSETVTLAVTVAPDAPLGPHELRLKTGGGLSNPLIFEVGTLPEFTAPVVTPTTARPANERRGNNGNAPPPARKPTVLPVTLPALVNGQILPGEIDHLRFSARAGQQLTVAASARALIPYLADAVPGWFQATLCLRDAAGHELAYADDFQHRPDPVLVCTIPADGDYTVEIKDAIYRGREDFVYRVALGELPYIQSVFPLGANHLTPTAITLTGWNLPTKALSVDPRHQPPALMQLSVKNHGHASNTVRFLTSDLPEQLETETDFAPPAVASTASITANANENKNPRPAPIVNANATTTLARPGIVHGRIDRPDDRDVFTFTARAGEQIVAEIHARRLGSPLDSTLTITDDTGATVASNDDYDDPAEGLLTHQADSRLLATLPRDGVYQLTVTDRQHRGGPEYGYRLTLRAPRADFALRVTPSAVNVPLGGTVPITVFAHREDGFTGAIELGLRHAPAGFRLSGATIPAGQNSVMLTLTAPTTLAPDAGITPLQLIGRAALDGQSAVRTATAADDTMQAFLYRHLVPAQRWSAVVTGRAGPPLRLVDPAPVVLRPGAPTEVRVALPESVGLLEQVKVELLNAPAGVSLGACQARRGQVRFDVIYDPAVLKAARSGNLIVALSAERPAQKKTGKKTNVTSLGIVPAIRFETAPP